MSYPIEGARQCLRAENFATDAHYGQFRKGSNQPYVFHPIRVAQIVASTPRGSVVMIMAALLHDTIEDCDVTYNDILQEFGVEVANLVYELTNKATPELGNRTIRKAFEAGCLSTISEQAQTIKLADLIDNTRDILEFDPGFAKVYLAEKRLLLLVMTKGDEALREQAWEQVVKAEVYLEHNR